MIGLLPILSACASPVKDISVTLDDFTTGATLQLANQSHSDFQGIYSRPREKADLKLVPDAVMQQLVTAIEDEGFDRYACLASQLEADQAGYSGMITLALDDRRRVFALTRSRNKTVEQTMSFIHMKQMILELFAQAFALQSLDNPEGSALFEQERRKLDERGPERSDDSAGHPRDGRSDGVRQP